MSGGLFNLFLDSDAQNTIARMAALTNNMPRYRLFAAEAVGKVIVGMIPSETDWKNGTGTLDSSFTMTPRPYGAEVGSDLPYARRREFSFKGPDSLGRMFPNDPAAYYLKKTLQDLPSQANDALKQLATYMGI